MALQAIRRQQTITEISKNHHCSRTTVYAQQTRALDAATKAFDETDEEVLFTGYFGQRDRSFRLS